MDKEHQREQILEDLVKVANFLPAPLYWLDLDHVVLGANNAAFEAAGSTNHREKVLGKAHTSYYPKDIADTLVDHGNQVLKLGHTIEFEEKTINIATGETKYFTSVRAPLRSYDGEVIGTIGTSIEITAEKENQRLRLAQLQEYQKFKNITDQMAHDLGSPLMALSVLENNCAELPEAKRNMLRDSIASIREIAGSLLNQYKPTEEIVEANNSSELLVYAAMEQIIIEKQHEYQHLSVKFEREYITNSRFVFIKGDVTSFKRMLSNLINNSVESLEGKSGSIVIKLENDYKEVRVSISDCGRGISQDIIDKIKNNISITSGKDKGHGIGFSQVRETLGHYGGKLNISSCPDSGTEVTLTFSKVQVPYWLTETITINANDTVIILDDDNSIHGAWDIRFNDILANNSHLKVKHFTQAVDVIVFIDNLTYQEKQSVLLLTDYELLKQSLNGLDVIQKTQIERSILVTSHYNNPKIRQRANFSNTRILPKILASFVPVWVANT